MPLTKKAGKYNRQVYYILRAYFVIFLQYRIVRDDNRLQPFLKYRKDLSLNGKQNNIYHYIAKLEQFRLRRRLQVNYRTEK